MALANSNSKRVGVAIQISDKISFRSKKKKIIRDKGHYIFLKGTM